MRKVGVFFFLPFLLAGYLQSQSVAELAQKEKERRESLKGKKGILITNAVLASSKKKAAVTVEEPVGTVVQEGETAAPPETAGEQAQGEQAQPAAEEEFISESEFRVFKSNYENAWKDNQRGVDDLTQRMNELWQSYYSMNDMTSRDLIQQRIAETYQALLKAQEDVVKYKADFDAFIAKAVKEGVPPSWIR
ncbi:MAG: hypothetical protein OEW05_08720 [Candidatus Aminicenantes bacterium]|nr:hypothetical protein [Candidatus Aminicenantes bacterium]